MAPSKVVSVRRVGGSPDHASRTKIFGPDANSDTLVCGVCKYGAKENWTPTMKKSQCPACGNREGHVIRRDDDGHALNCCFQSMVLDTESPESNGELEGAVNAGWEVVGIAPFRMGPNQHGRPGKGTATVVNEYFIMMRRFA